MTATERWLIWFVIGCILGAVYLLVSGHGAIAVRIVQ